MVKSSIWHRCCGAKVIHDFVGGVDQQALTTIMAAVPDNQVYAGETLNPKLAFAALNESQMGHAPEQLLLEAGFVEFLAAPNVTFGPDDGTHGINLHFFVKPVKGMVWKT